jgi:hypothetical protein
MSHAASLLDVNTDFVKACILIKIIMNTMKTGKKSFVSTLDSDKWMSKQLNSHFCETWNTNISKNINENHNYRSTN